MQFHKWTNRKYEQATFSSSSIVSHELAARALATQFMKRISIKYSAFVTTHQHANIIWFTLCSPLIGHPVTLQTSDWLPEMSGANLSIRHRKRMGTGQSQDPAVEIIRHEDQIIQSVASIGLKWPMRGQDIIRRSGDNAKHRRPGPVQNQDKITTTTCPAKYKSETRRK